MNIDDLYELRDNIEKQQEAKKQELLDKIKQAQDRVAKKDELIKELLFERNLIFNDFLGIVNKDLRDSYFNLFRGCVDDFLWKAWMWSCNKDKLDKKLKKEELTKEGYKTYKLFFEISTKDVKNAFFGNLKDDVKFKSIIMSWTTGYEFTYTYKDQEIIIFIPLFRANDENTLYDTLRGYRVNYKESEHCEGWICGGLDYKEVGKTLQEWLKNESWKKESK